MFVQSESSNGFKSDHDIALSLIVAIANNKYTIYEVILLYYYLTFTNLNHMPHIAMTFLVKYRIRKKWRIVESC